jgi:4-diphosphocytidyl-2C-methyl-D-erythritol kinase
LRSADNDANIPLATILPGEDSGACRFVNDLEAAAVRVRPQLADLRAMVADQGFPSVGMSGSGSTLFLAFAGARECAAARERLLALELRGVRLMATRSAVAAATPVPRPWPGAGIEVDLP